MSLDLCITDGIPTECFVEVFYSALLIKMEFAHTLLEMSPFEEQAHALWHIHCTAISPNKLQTEWALCYLHRIEKVESKHSHTNMLL